VVTRNDLSSWALGWVLRAAVVAPAACGALAACSDANPAPPLGEGRDDAAVVTPQVDAGTILATQDARVGPQGSANDASSGPLAIQDAGARDAAPNEPARADAAPPAADAAAVDATGAPADASSAASLPPVTSTAADGPFRAVEDLSAGPKGKSGLFHPAELGRAGVKHPVFEWGCGGSSTPAQYAEQLRRIATHGFIVIADVSAIGDNGLPLRESIDWIIAENARAASPFFGVVETGKIALGGHSIGSANSFFIADDPRLTTTIHVAGGSLDDVRDPFAPTTGMGGKRLVHPVAYICSMRDSFGNVEKTQKDYDNTRVPAWMTVMTGVDHVAAARSGLPATIAWLRWHLAGERERQSAFLSAGGEFTTGMWVSRSKNW
jgi:hypothetical protein